MDAALARGKGVVFVTGHVGNWELLARYVALENYPAYVIGKELSDERTTGLVERFRASGKLRVIWRGRSGAAKEMLRALKSNSILGILIDQDTKVQSVWVPFFGRLAKTRIAPEELARLQLYIVRSHAAGVGEPLADSTVRLTLALKVIALPWILHRLVRQLNVKGEVEALINIPTTMLVGIVLVMVAFNVALPLSELSQTITRGTLGDR